MSTMKRKAQCRQCGAELAVEVEVDGLPRLLAGGVVVQSIHGCCICGEPFHWSMSEALLQRLIERVGVTCLPPGGGRD